MSSNNIVTDSGDSFIPPSQRPDGTWRKARRVKEGYVPQEEVPLYESKGKQFMTRKPEPIKLQTGETAHTPIPGLYIIEDKEKTKPKKNKANKSCNKVEDVITKQLNNVKISDKKSQAEAEATDPAKKLKNLKKRLREVEALEEKLEQGLITKPEPEQLAKIKRKNDLIVQIHELEKQIG